MVKNAALMLSCRLEIKCFPGKEERALKSAPLILACVAVHMLLL